MAWSGVARLAVLPAPLPKIMLLERRPLAPMIELGRGVLLAHVTVFSPATNACDVHFDLPHGRELAPMLRMGAKKWERPRPKNCGSMKLQPIPYGKGNCYC